MAFLVALIISVVLLVHPVASQTSPVAFFTYTPTTPIFGQIVVFNASASYDPDGGTIVSYKWDFDDGIVYTVDEPVATHNYTTIGTYNVTLTVTDTEDLVNNAWTPVTVRKHPYATFIYSPDLPLVGETVTFNASLSTGDGGTIMNYTWDFGDGVSVTETDPIATHVYTDFGTYNVTLTVEDSEDLADSFTDIIRILIIPVANFTYSPTKPIINEIVTFDASDSYDPDRSIVSYAWDFGDGNITMAETVITHVYTTEETYNVTLTVTDDDGLTDTMWKLITVYSFLYTHDVAIISVTPSTTKTYPERIVNITVTAKNEGTAVESFSVTTYYNFMTIGTQPVTNLLPNEEITLIFSWNTTNLTPSNYTLSAQASVVPGETETTDNNYSDGWVVVTIAGDVNSDGTVTAPDIIKVGDALFAQPGDSNYNPMADVNGDGKIGAPDIILIGDHLFESWP